jgi:hypothetical protein
MSDLVGFSSRDYRFARRLTTAQGSPVDAFVIDPEHVHRYRKRNGMWLVDETGVIPRNAMCVKGGGLAL